MNAAAGLSDEIARYRNIRGRSEMGWWDLIDAIRGRREQQQLTTATNAI